MEFTVFSPMPFGVHKRVPVRDVPSKYLIAWVSNPPQEKYLEFHSFIKSILHAIKSPLWDMDKSIFTKPSECEYNNKPSILDCPKTYFLTKKDANYRLSKIQNSQSFSGKKPVRSYECDKCGFWHLTSMEIYEK